MSNTKPKAANNAATTTPQVVDQQTKIPVIKSSITDLNKLRGYCLAKIFPNQTPEVSLGMCQDLYRYVIAFQSLNFELGKNIVIKKDRKDKKDKKDKDGKKHKKDKKDKDGKKHKKDKKDKDGKKHKKNKAEKKDNTEEKVKLEKEENKVINTVQSPIKDEEKKKEKEDKKKDKKDKKDKKKDKKDKDEKKEKKDKKDKDEKNFRD